MIMNSKFNFKFSIILILLAVSAAISWKSYFTQFASEDTVSIHAFPMQVGEWTATELPISERDLAILETTNAFTREYAKPNGDKVMLLIVYSEKNRRAAHPPEICYSGGGISILSSEDRDLHDPASRETIKSRRMFVEAGRYQQAVNYWFKVGDTQTSNYYKQQFLIAVKTLLQQNASSAMIRIAADVENKDVMHADERIREFAFDILPLLPSYLP